MFNDGQIDRSPRNLELVNPDEIEGLSVVLCHRPDDVTKVRSLAKELVSYGINARNNEVSQTDAWELRMATFVKSLSVSRASIMYVTKGAISKWQKSAAIIIDAHQKSDQSFQALRFVVGEPFRTHDGQLQPPDWTQKSAESEAAVLASAIKTKLGAPPKMAKTYDGSGCIKAGLSDAGSGTTTTVASPSHDDMAQSSALKPAVGSGHPRPVEHELSDTEGGTAPTMSGPSDDDEPRIVGVIRNKYQNRPYARTGPGLLQWFHPLPIEPNPPLLTSQQVREDQERIQAAAQCDSKVASDLLEQATALLDHRDDRIKAAETKATTLMGAVAIAASLIVAGAGLILDSSKVAAVWREILILTVLALLFCLLMCGYLSSRALLTVRTMRRPQARQALSRAKKGNANNARVERALDLIERANDNRYVADFKVVQNEVAHRWYKLALVLFVALGTVLAAYVIFGTIPI